VYVAAASYRPHPLEGLDPVALVDVIEEAKEKARAETRSKNLLLQDIHARYAMPGSPARFVRTHRRFHLEDIQEAERRLRTRACRCQTWACDRYFTGILANVAEAASLRRAGDRRRREMSRKLESDRQADAQREAHFEEHPEERMVEALRMIACQWKPLEGKLLFGGVGLGRKQLRHALVSLIERNAVFWEDDVERAWNAWLAEGREVPPAAVIEIRRVLDRVIIEQTTPSSSAPPASRTAALPRAAAQAILKPQARSPEHPPPLRNLRN
jgi:hypothetical protein